MNEFIEAVGEFKMKTQRISNLSAVSIIHWWISIEKFRGATIFLMNQSRGGGSYGPLANIIDTKGDSFGFP